LRFTEKQQFQHDKEILAMATIKLRELRRRIELEGMKKTCRHFRKALMEGVLTADDMSIRDLAEAFVVTRNGDPCGREWVASMNPSRGEPVTLLEADGAVDSSIFANLTSQLAFSAIMEGYQLADFIHDELATTRPTKFRKEVIPGISGIVEDMTDDVAEGMPFQAVGFGEDYRETPLTTKKGRLIYVTKEAIFHDQTGLILEAARGIGELLGLRREKDFAKLLLGLSNNYKWRGTSYNTYQTAAPWINVKSGNGLVVANGWVQIDAVEQLFANMLDPNTGEPINVTVNQIVHMPPRTHQFRQVTRATNIRSEQATTGTHVQTDAPNTLDPYQLKVSKHVYKALTDSGVAASDAADWWFTGDFKAAIEWIENWPMLVAQMPTNAEAEFKQDIVLGFKASMKGVYAMKQPRKIVKSYQA
jgi:hypothetical protein